jgi:uncharacterized protein
MPFDLTPLAALWMAVAILGAAYVRGYSGFGFSALIVASSSLVTDPVHFVPVVLIADILLTAQQVPSIRGHVDWPRVRWLLTGAVFGVPAGVWAVASIGTDQARAAISIYILCMCAILIAGWSFRSPPGTAPHIATGVISGLANGASVGGLPVAAFFAAQTMPAATFRATLIGYFTVMDLVTVPLMITADTLRAVALGLPLMVAGIWAGTRRFTAASPQSFRLFAIGLLAVLAALGLLRSAL